MDYWNLLTSCFVTVYIVAIPRNPMIDCFSKKIIIIVKHTQAVLRHRSGLWHTLHNDPYSQKERFNLGRARVATRLRGLSHCFISLHLFVYCPLSGVLSFGGITLSQPRRGRYADWFDIEWRERILLSLGVEKILYLSRPGTLCKRAQIKK